MDLKTKISSSVVAVVAIGGFSLLGAVLFEQNEIISSQINLHFIQTTKRLAIELEKCANEDDFTEFRHYYRNLKSELGFLSAYLMDGKGRLIYHPIRDIIGVQNPHFHQISFEHSEQDVSIKHRHTLSGVPVIQYVKKIEYGAGKKGWVCLLISEDTVATYIKRSLTLTAYRILIIGFITIVIGVGIAVWVSRTITKPLGGVQEGLKRVAEGRWISLPNDGQKNEIGSLTNEFNVTMEKLQELDNMKQEFVSTVTHELRSPLTAIGQLTTLLLNNKYGPLRNKQREAILVLKNNATRLGSFIDNILTTSKLDARRTDVYLDTVDLAEVVMNTHALYAPSFHDKGIDFRMDFSNDRPWDVRTDKDKISHVLNNLVSNAYKFTEQGTVLMGLYENNGEIELRVTDTGIGIPPKDKEKIFEKFFRGPSTARKIKGTGLGLSIVKSFLDLLNARVTVRDNPGGGSIFSVFLPRMSPSESFT